MIVEEKTNKEHQALIRKIKNSSWEIRVTRPGFLQPKQIVNQSVVPIKLSRNVILKFPEKFLFWANDLNIFGDSSVDEFPRVFEQAFKEDKYWPIKIVDKLDHHGQEIDRFIQKIQHSNWKNASKQEKLFAFRTYVSLVESIDKYYTVGEHLVNHCETILAQQGIDFMHCAVPIRSLELSKVSRSKNIAKDFAWIKTAYNIISRISQKDISNLRNEAATQRDGTQKGFKTKDFLIEAMQCGIYIRNRIKELSQKMWYNIEGLLQSIAKDIKLDRDSFLHLTPKEAHASMIKGASVVPLDVIKRRKESFVVIALDKGEAVISGKAAQDIAELFNKPHEHIEIKGTVACKGIVKGIARVIKYPKHIGKFLQGEILITPMTTPDFMVVLKKAAAIVTDEGGLACHAAIISRELGIPCIIGTQAATKAIKSGDKILVNAIKGIVTKIN